MNKHYLHFLKSTGFRIYFAFLVVSFIGIHNLSAQNQSGVSTNLQLLLKADVGTLAGTTVPSWQGQSTNAYNLTDTGTTPYNFISNGLNFNPTIQNPDGSNRILGLLILEQLKQEDKRIMNKK